jgi:hypothetical protein
MMRRWFAYEGVWKEKKDDTWILSAPPIPDWAEPLDLVRFVDIWVSSPDKNTIKKYIFWLSDEEIEHIFEQVSLCLCDEGYQPLPERGIRERGLFSSQQLLTLEERGLIVLEERSEDSAAASLERFTQGEDDDYDVVQALLSAPQKKYEPQSHIQTSEGRFQAKH